MDKEELKIEQEKIQKELDNILSRKRDLDKIDTQFTIEEARKNIGKFYIFKNNCYSCPKNKNDYWNIYYKIIGIDRENNYEILGLQKDSFGNINIKKEAESIFFFNREEITEQEFIRGVFFLFTEINEIKEILFFKEKGEK